MLLEQSELVIHPGAREVFPSLYNALEAELPEFGPVIVKPDLFSDRTPRLSIPIPQGTRTAVIPGFISGRHAEGQLSAISKAAHALRFSHPSDSRTPWVQHAHILLTDFEGRGNKPTVLNDDRLMDEAELHYAYYLAAMLNASLADSATILDPHDADSVRALVMPVTTITALGECGAYMKKHNLIPQNSGVITADNGAIGRSLFFAHATDLPLTARIVKQRVNGKPQITAVYGGEQIRGRTAILVDDMIATGGTLFTDSEVLTHTYGAKEVIAVVTHIKGIPGAREKIVKKLRSNKHGLSTIIITNSTPYADELTYIPGIHTVNIFPLIACAARCVLAPTQENIDALAPHLFPINDVPHYLKALWEEDQSLAPDYDPPSADNLP